MAAEIEKREEDQDAGEALPADSRSPILPLVLTLAALLLYFAFQTLNLTFERGNLLQVKASQEGAIQEAERIQVQFKTLISRTGQLAEKGHPGAKMVMEGLQAQGLGLSGAPTAAPSEAKPGP